MGHDKPLEDGAAMHGLTIAKAQNPWLRFQAQCSCQWVGTWAGTENNAKDEYSIHRRPGNPLPWLEPRPR